VSAEVRIERLALRVAGLDQDGARALARLVAEALAAELTAAGVNARREYLHLEVSADTGNPELLARRIVGEIGRALGRGRLAGTGEAVR
jgi:hypothetical protein